MGSPLIPTMNAREKDSLARTDAAAGLTFSPDGMSPPPDRKLPSSSIVSAWVRASTQQSELGAIGSSDPSDLPTR